MPEPTPSPGRRTTAPPTARIASYRCRRAHGFRIIWPEVDAPLIHPCPSCGEVALRLISTRPDAA